MIVGKTKQNVFTPFNPYQETPNDLNAREKK